MGLFGQEKYLQQEKAFPCTCKPQNYPVAAAAVTIPHHRESSKTGNRPPSEQEFCLA